MQTKKSPNLDFKSDTQYPNETNNLISNKNQPEIQNIEKIEFGKKSKFQKIPKTYNLKKNAIIIFISFVLLVNS